MIHTLILLLGWHALADFPLQGEFMSKFKNPWLMESPLRVSNGWQWIMGSHCMIHAAGVYVITGIWWLALCEFILHWVIDLSKCRGRISFNADQMFHIVCKIEWAAIATYLIS